MSGNSTGTGSSSGTMMSSAAKPSAASTTDANKDSSTSTSAATATATAVATTPENSSNGAISLKKLPRVTFSKSTPAPPNSFQEYLERLDDEKQISYLMLGATEVLSSFNVKRTHPYSYLFFKKKGYKQIFQPNKNIIVQEIKRRQPEAKPNQNNRSNDELMEMLRERWPLLEPDKRYIIQKEKDYRKLLMSVLNPKDVIQLDELTNLVASPSSGTTSGLPSVPMASSNPSRKRSIGEMDLSSGSANHVAVAASSVMINSNNSNNKRRSSSSACMNDNINFTALGTILFQAANECADKLSYANLANTVEILKKERFECHMKKLPLTAKHTPANAQSIACIDNRIKEITDSIESYEAKMGVPSRSGPVGV